MKKSTLAILLLVIALLVSNGWWAYQLLDSGVSYTYLEQNFNDHREALTTAMAVLPVAAQSVSTPEAVIAAAVAAANGEEPFEKEGFIWVGGLGLQFGPEGRLAAVSPAWSPF